MSRANNQNRIALLDGLVRYHAQKFVELEARRIKLHAHSQNRPVAPLPSIGQDDRASVRAEIAAIKAKLDQLMTVL